MKANTVEVVRPALDLGGKFIEGAGGLTEETSKATDYVGEEIMKLGKMLEPAKR